MFVHVSHDNSCWVCSCTLATNWVRAFGFDGSRFYCHRSDFDWLIGSYDVEKAEIRSSASSLVVKLRTTSTNCTRAIPQSCGRDKIPPSFLGYDNTIGVRVIIWYYKRCKSNSSKLREIREWFLEATREEEKATRRLEKVNNSQAWNAVQPSTVKANCWLKVIWHLVSSCALNVVIITNDCFDCSRT